ncbi:DEKNAAC102614 [Brettanomyces naardenensis]|uniref:DEKNAAC102614 n=1 Tax=Brettanomyces naardenensis TaxID=13370 RepID=A0A448YLA8_BRENA|nr:DEKNAAC102614 [Brettanomyces naardenensis]
MTTDHIMREVSDKPPTYDKQDDYTLPPGKRLYMDQYNDIYKSRAKILKSRVMKMASSKWRNETINEVKAKYVNKLLDVKNLTPSYVIGTVFVDMKYKPNILKEVSGNIYEAPEFEDESQYSELDRTRIDSYSDPSSDQVMLEDDSGRLLLDGELLDKVVLVTGVVVGVLGMVVEAGIFTIVDIVYPEPGPQKPLPEAKDENILFISGLRISPTSDRAPLEILKEFIMGEISSGVDNVAEMLEKTTNLIILGNSIEVVDDPHKNLKGKDKYSEINKSNYDSESLKMLDRWISDLLVSIPVTILPGETDPAEIEFPKPPLHRSLFYHSSRRSNFERLSNPAWLEINGVRILATSGENVNDIFKYLIPNIHVEIGDGIDSPLRKEVLHDSRLKLLESTILWQNVAPTAPDTMCCYPYSGEDPFSLTETPHVYVVGNQPKFETSILEVKLKNDQVARVSIICVPDFSETGQCVMMNTNGLECKQFRVA